MTYLGIDFGLARIGLAVSDSGLQSRPLETIPYRGKKSIERIRDIITKYCGGMHDKQLTIVVGLSGNTDGAREFGLELSRELKCAVEFVDERLSSVEAQEYIRNVMGIRKIEKIKELLDSVSASVILQRYLDKRSKENA